jgi:hypothetical protein
MNTKSWIEALSQITDEFENSFGNLNKQKLNWKPNAGVWSIAQIIEHLIVTNQSYLDLLEKIKSGKHQLPFHARFNFVTSLFGKLLLNAVNPNKKRKLKTFKIWEPEQSEVSNDIVFKFVEQQKKLQEAIKESTELISNGCVISSPANKNIVYKLETAFDIIIAHEQRHLNQAKELNQQNNKNLYNN